MKQKKQNLEELTKTWYAKLKKAGFDDAENSQGLLRVWESTRLIETGASDDYNYAMLKPKTKHAQHRTMNEQRAEYYRLAGHFLYDNKWKSKRQRRLWELHAEGITYQAIAKKFHTNYSAIYIKIAPLIKAMKEMYGVTSLRSGTLLRPSLDDDES